VALSTSFSDAERTAVIVSKLEISSKRKRLHLLYLINDLIHHTKVHLNNAWVSTNLQPVLASLFWNVSSFKNSPKHLRKVRELLSIWEERQYYPTDDINKLRAVVEAAQGPDASSPSRNQDPNTLTINVPRASKEIPFTMPAIHGDQNLPWYDLPAGNLMEHIVPNSTRPINPSLVKPLRFMGGPADESLASAVKTLLQDVNSIYSSADSYDEMESSVWDVDELGQQVLRDEISGDILSGEGYYGWSRAFCEKMKRRYRGGGVQQPPTDLPSQFSHIPPQWQQMAAYPYQPGPSGRPPQPPLDSQDTHQRSDGTGASGYNNNDNYSGPRGH